MINIPKWPTSCTNAEGVYRGCPLLNAIWNSGALPSEIMPPAITSHANAVTGTDAALRAYFTSDWGGTKSE